MASSCSSSWLPIFLSDRLYFLLELSELLLQQSFILKTSYDFGFFGTRSLQQIQLLSKLIQAISRHRVEWSKGISAPVFAQVHVHTHLIYTHLMGGSEVAVPGIAALSPTSENLYKIPFTHRLSFG